MDPYADPLAMDPMMGMDDPALLDDAAIDDYLLAQEDLPRVGPVLPPGYRKPPKPSADALVIAKADHARHQTWLNLVAQTQARIRLDPRATGFLESDEQMIKDKQLQTYQSPELAAEHRIVCNRYVATDIAYDALHLDEVDEDEATDKEDALAFWREEEQRQHFARGYGLLKWAEIDTIQKTSCVIGYDAIDPNNDRCGLTMRLLDPTTTFFTHEGDRLRHVTRLYRAPARVVVGDFDDEDGAVAQKVYGTRKKGPQGIAGATTGPHDEVEVVEWIDDWWHAVWVNDVLIKAEDHAYGEVPVTVAVGNWNDQPFMSSLGDGSDTVMVDGAPLNINVTGMQAVSDEWAIARQRVPFLFHQFTAHDQKEVIQGITLTMLHRMRDQKFVQRQGPTSAAEGETPAVDLSRSIVATVRDDDAMEPVLPQVQPQVMAAALQQIAETDAILGIPKVLAGQVPGAQTPGTVIDELKGLNLEKYAVVFAVLETFHAARAEKRLKLFRDWGALVGTPGSRNRGIAVPRRSDLLGQTEAFRLTPDAISRTGVRVMATLHRSTGMPDPAATASAVQLKAMGIPLYELVKRLDLTTDPDGMMRRARRELFDESPEAIQTDTVDYWMDMAQRAYERGDELSFNKFMGRIGLVTARARRSPSAAGTPADPNAPPAQDPSMAPPAAGALPDPGYQGMSTPDYAVPTGTQGGRPQGPPPVPSGVM